MNDADNIEHAIWRHSEDQSMPRLANEPRRIRYAIPAIGDPVDAHLDAG